MRRPRFLSAAFAALLCGMAVVGCATLAPGADPYVVRAEQALRAGDALYVDGMAYYFTPGVAAGMSPNVKAIFEAVRTGFDPAYKDLQGALDSYKAVKAAIAAGQVGDPAVAQAKLNDAILKLGSLVNRVLSQIPGALQKKSGGKPVGGA